ncbi:MAG TPA: hypothetical protein VK186_13995 [Candidatus Deferrimicrobium sp.]|nr:hypothetical protein [Candidatus Deferrimicrobium sp.]
MKKLILCLLFTAFSISFLIGEEDYADIKNLLIKQEGIFQSFIAGCDNVKNAQDVVKLITNFKDGFKELTPMLIAVAKNHKDLDTVMQTNPPETLKAELAKINELGPKVDAGFSKISTYMTDAEVMKALQEFQQVMLNLQNELAPEKKTTEPANNTQEPKKSEG